MLADLGHSVVDGLSHRLFDKPLQRKQKYIHRKETLIAAIDRYRKTQVAPADDNQIPE